jgi:hypothetical protein
LGEWLPVLNDDLRRAVLVINLAERWFHSLVLHLGQGRPRSNSELVTL